MGRNRKSYSDAFKNKVVLELLKSNKRQEEIAAEFSIAPSTVCEWKNEFLSGNDKKKLKAAQKEIEALKEKNKALIEALGMSQLEVELLKKKEELLNRKTK